MLIDHTQLTDPALVHLFPLRLVQVDWLDPARRGARTVFFLYRHFHGGWAVGSVPGSADSGELVPSGLALRAVRDGRLDEAGARRLFETLLAGQAGLSGGRVWCTELPHLPLAVELRLAQAWVRPALPPVANQPRGIPEVQLYLHLCQGMRAVLPSAQAQDLATWLGDLYSDTEGQMPLGLLSNEAHLWAFVLTEAALSQQDGLADALSVLQRQGAAAFCALLDPKTLATVASWLEQARENFPETAPRCAVADVVHSSLALHANLLLEHWNARPREVPLGPTSVLRQWLPLPLPLIPLTTVYRTEPSAKPAPGTVPSRHWPVRLPAVEHAIETSSEGVAPKFFDLRPPLRFR